MSEEPTKDFSQLERLDEKFDNVIRDLYEVRADVGLHDKRLKEIERRLNP